jgi:hypothetical protein
MADSSLVYDADESVPHHQLLATELWTYVHTRLPRFSPRAAEEVVARLAPQPGEDIKRLAKRLREAMANKGVAIKHAAALEAAARLAGHANWHTANRTGVNRRLQLMPMASTDRVEDLFAGPKQDFSDWMELVPRMATLCDGYLQATRGSMLQVRFEPGYILVGAPLPRPGNRGGDDATGLPVFSVIPLKTDDSWMDGSHAAFEALRRHLEEAGRAVLDGVATLQLCQRYDDRRHAGAPGRVQLADVANTELVLMREDNDLSPHQGFEIARGNELTCWAQLELAMKDAPEDAEVVLDGEAWRVGKGRYVWDMVTLLPHAFIPGLVTRRLNEDDAERLFRRYGLVKRILGGHVRHHEVNKTLAYPGGPSESCRLNLHRTLMELDKAGHSWESMCEALDSEQAMQDVVPFGFVMSLAERLELKNPNILFAVPNRAEMHRAEDDRVLRALLPRIDTLRFRLGPMVPDDAKAAARKAVEDLNDSMRVRKMSASGVFVDSENELPQLVYGGDGEDLRLALEQHGLVIYTCVLPHLFPLDQMREQMPLLENASPYAFGHALFLDIDLLEAASGQVPG